MAESGSDIPPTLDYAMPPPRPKSPLRWLLWLMWGGLLVLLLVLIAPMFPPVGGPRDTSPRVKSASNLRQIGQAILLYTDDHQGEYPDSFQTILLNEDVTSSVFVSPSSSDTPAVGPTTQGMLDQLVAGGHLSYVYLGRGLSVHAVTPDTIVAYELPANPNMGTNVLFGDGHVEFVDAGTAAKIIAARESGEFPVTRPSVP